MTVKLTPYGLGREWASGKGPHIGDYFAAMEAHCFTFNTPEEAQFAVGADAWFDELNEYGEESE